MDEGVAACRLFLRDFAFHSNDLDFLVDSIENKFESAYASWPFRFWVLTRAVTGSLQGTAQKGIDMISMILKSF
jgi:hypothetical protein